MSKSNRKSNFPHRRSLQLIAIFAIVLICISIYFYEYLTEPQEHKLPVGYFSPVNYHNDRGYTIGFNGTTYPLEFNETGGSYAITVEILLGPPSIIYSGTSIIDGFGISILNSSVKGPYTNVSFYISAASMTIGNSCISDYQTQIYSSNISHLYLGFHPVSDSFLELTMNHGTNYSGYFSITISPVLHLYVYHIQEKSFTIKWQTELPWYHIE